MSEERTFLNESNVYVSNTRVVINGATYATANVTSVRTTTTPAKTGCAGFLAILGAVVTIGGITTIANDSDGHGALITGLRSASSGSCQKSRPTT